MGKKCFMVLLLSLFGIYTTQAGSPVLKFNQDGKFKIVQFTDVHFKYGNPASDIALERINEVLDAEKPDFVIFTGDVIYYGIRVGIPAENTFWCGLWES